MRVHTSLALALVNATASAMTRASEAQKRPHWVALRVADRCDRREDAGTINVRAMEVRASRKTREKILREQRIEV